MQRAILLRLCLVLSLAGMLTAGATLATIVRQYCADEGDECEGEGLTTLSYMSRQEPARAAAFAARQRHDELRRASALW